MKNKLMQIADFYGRDNQFEQTEEECAELIHAIQRYKRALKTGKLPIIIQAEQAVLRERADVQIMLRQLVYIESDKAKLKAAMRAKVNRQLKRIDEEIEAMQVNATELNQEPFPS